MIPRSTNANNDLWVPKAGRIASYVGSNSTILDSNYLTLKGSFSAVSKPNVASKYALESSFAPFSNPQSKNAPFLNRIPKTRKTMGEKEPGPTPGKQARRSS